MSTILRIKAPRPRCNASSCRRPAFAVATIIAFYWGLSPGERVNLCLGHFYGAGFKLADGLGQQLLEMIEF